jgi:hypothetical protein
MPRFRVLLGRLMMAITAATLLVPGAAFAGGAIAFANVDCAISDPPWYQVSVSTKDVLFTHSILYVSLAPDAYASRTLTKTTSFTAGITITVGASAEAGVILASASASLKVALKGEGSVTSGTSVTLGVTNNTDKYHDWVFFDGTRTATGKWTKYYCSAGVVKVTSAGTWYSWDAQYGAVLRCDQDSKVASTYGAWSTQYKAVTSC